MKKTISILLLVLLIAGVIISCDNKVKANSNETVSVSFVESSSKDLTVEHQAFNLNELYWKYAAQKADGSGLSQGATESYSEGGAKWIKPNSDNTAPTEPGYGVVGGFSQGLWNFTLYGYTKVINSDSNPEYKLVVFGESKNVSLVFGGPNTVSVKVAPVYNLQQKGTLTIDKIGFNYAKTSGDSLGTGVSYNVEVTNLSDAVQSGTKNDDTNVYTYTLNPGAYKATISYSLGTDPKYTFATGTKLVQVWSNQNTTIKGNLNELITSSDFGATIDPLVLFASTDTATNTAINKYQGISKLTYTDNNDSPKLKLEIPSAVAKCYIYNYKDKSYPENSSRTPNADDQINFTASVETTAISTDSVTYNIALDYSVKPNYATKYQGPFRIPLISGTQVDVSASIPAVTITLKIDTGLKNIKVVRGVYEMTSSDDLTGVDEGYNYNLASGELQIKTKLLGAFKVQYTR